jgi:hypothetical protein
MQHIRGRGPAVSTDRKQNCWEHIATKPETRTDDPDVGSMFKTITNPESACRSSTTRVLGGKRSPLYNQSRQRSIPCCRLLWSVASRYVKQRGTTSSRQIHGCVVDVSEGHKINLYQVPCCVRRKELWSSSRSSIENPGTRRYALISWVYHLNMISRARCATITLLKIP